MRKTVFIFVISLFLLVIGPIQGYAGNFTITMPPGQSLTMNDGIGTLSFVVTNTACTTGGCNIRTIDFYFPNAGSIIWPEWSTQPPNANWTVTTYSGANSNRIRFSTTTDGITLNSSRTFTIDVKGNNWGNLPRSASDSIDQLNNIVCAGSEAFNRTGNLPSWIRRSLAVSMTAYPDIIGIGQTFNLLDQVENRSTAAKASITANPAFPTPVFTGGAAVTSTAGPVYNPNPLSLNAGVQGTILYTYRADATGTVTFSNSTCATSLTANINAAAVTLPVVSTAGCPSSGTVIIDSEEIRYTGLTVNSFTGCTRGLNTAAVAHNNGAVVSGTASSISAASATSKASVSNTVSIGPIAISVSVSPTSVTSGQNVTVSMKVQNTGRTTTLTSNIDANVRTIFVTSTAAFPTSGTIQIDNEQISCTWKTAISFRNCTRGVNGTTAAAHTSGAVVRSLVAYGSIVPTLTSSGTATVTLVSGPVPTENNALYSGQSGNFTWVYNITGTVGQTYQFQGFVTSDGLYTSNTASSQLGRIASYVVSTVPDTVGGGYSAPPFSFTYYNNDPSALTINCIGFQQPAGWTAPSNMNGCTPVPAGGSRSCNANMSAPSPTSDTIYAFYSDLYNGGGWNGTQCTGSYIITLLSYITVTVNRIVVTHAPAGPINADGTSTYTITATLTNASSGAAISGATIVFATTAGRLSPTTAVTNAAGIATTTLTAPISQTNLSAVVTATYIKAQGRDTVNFNGVAGANLQYVGGSLLPLTVCRGYNYSFSLRVKNYGTAPVTLNTTSYFQFPDPAGTVRAYLDSGATINAGATASLTFGSPTNTGGGGGITVSSGLAVSSYTPYFYPNGSAADKRFADSVSVQACTPAAGGKVKMMRWREVTQ